ncbi:MAG: hypothetical protein M1836_004664 [Candelina mexicana]|nr:MAG: hypothetical protein M1836_004664 [Candelina mexicana]
MQDDKKIYPFNLASTFPHEDLADVDRRLREDAGRLFRNDKLRIGLETFSKADSAILSGNEATDQRGDHPKLYDDNIITDYATFQIEFEV